MSIAHIIVIPEGVDVSITQAILLFIGGKTWHQLLHIGRPRTTNYTKPIQATDINTTDCTSTDYTQPTTYQLITQNRLHTH